MSYTKTTWVNDTEPAINATNLNKIEQGIYDNNTNIGDLTSLTTTADTDLVSAINEVDAQADDSTAKLDGTKVAGDMVVDSIRTKNMLDTQQCFVASGNITIQDCTNGVIDIQGISGYYSRVAVKVIVKPNTNYTIKYKAEITSGSNDPVCAIKKLDNSTNIDTATGTGYKTITFTTTEAGVYVNFFATQSANTGRIKYSEIQLEEGSSATDYEKNQNLNIENGIWKNISSSVGVSTTQMPNLLLHSAYAKKVGNMVSLNIILKTSTEIPTGVNLNACCWLNNNAYFPNCTLISYCMTNDNYDYPDWNGNTGENIAFLRVQNDGQIIVRTKKTGQKVIVIHITY